MTRKAESKTIADGEIMTFAKAEELDYERAKPPEVQLWASVLHRWLDDLKVFDVSDCNCINRNCPRCRDLFELQQEARADLKDRNMADNDLKTVIKNAGLSSDQEEALLARARAIVKASETAKIPPTRLKRRSLGRLPYLVA